MPKFNITVVEKSERVYLTETIEAKDVSEAIDKAETLRKQGALKPDTGGIVDVQFMSSPEPEPDFKPGR